MSGDENRRTRVVLVLKHSLAADEEINALLPDTLAEYEEALARGELKSLRVRHEAGSPEKGAE